MRDALPRERQRAFVVGRRLAVVGEFVVRVAEQRLPSRQAFASIADAGAELERTLDVPDRVMVRVASQRLLGGALEIVYRPRLLLRALPMSCELAVERFEVPGMILLKRGCDCRMEGPPLREWQQAVSDLLADDVAKLIFRACAGSDRSQQLAPDEAVEHSPNVVRVKLPRVDVGKELRLERASDDACGL